jgi:N-acetylneuraminate synthase
VSTVAAALGASILERHLTLDRTMDGPDHAASLEPQGFKKLVRDIQQVAIALGTGEEKFISRGEILNREVLGKSLVQPGILPETITPKSAVKGPAWDLSQRYRSWWACRARYRADEPFQESDLGVDRPGHGERPADGIRLHRRLRFEDRSSTKSLLEYHFTDGT